MHIDELTATTPIVLEEDGIVAHAVGCPDANGTQQNWGQGHWPAGCCIDVDVIPNRARRLPTPDREPRRSNTVGTSKGRKVPANVATTRQVNYIHRLMAERNMSEEQALAVSDTGAEYGSIEALPKFAASMLIDLLLATNPAAEALPVNQVEQYLVDLGRQVELDDMTPQLLEAANGWAKGYRGTFSFMRDMRRNAGTKGLTKAQAKGVLNCWRSDLQRQGPTATQRKATGLDLSDLPAGRYAVPGGETRLKLHVQRPKDGTRWEGWVFVKDAAVYGEGKRYGSQKPGNLYSGEAVAALRTILEDPKAASIAYGKLVGVCGRCNRTLEDEASVAAGIGPVCATRW